MNLNANDQVGFLHCLICYRKVQRARMCPYCSKLGCHDCLSSWSLKQGQCPNCREQLGFADYANCERLIEQIRQQFMLKDQNGSQRDFCAEHHLRMRYFCQQCSIAFCSDCSAFTEIHKGHKVKLMSEIFQKQRERIQKEIIKFDERIQDHRQKGMAIKMELQKMVQAKNHRRSFIESYIRNMQDQLEGETKQKQSIILSRFQTNEEEIQLLENIKDTILGDLQDYSQNQVIVRTQEILHLIKSLCERNVEQLQIDTNFTTISQLVPDYQSFTYVLADFSTLGQGIIYSPGYSWNSCEWRLKIYPRGNGIAKGKYISVFLEMSKGVSNKIKYQYKIELVNHLNLNESMPREYSSEFEIGECWGYNQFIQLKTLDLGYLADDQLTFKFYIRNPTYRDMVIQQKKYIYLLESKLKDLERTLINKPSSAPLARQNRIKESIQMKRSEARSQLMMVNSIQNQALDASHNRMEEKEEPVDS